jgi:hypothetical protein
MVLTAPPSPEPLSHRHGIPRHPEQKYSWLQVQVDDVGGFAPLAYRVSGFFLAAKMSAAAEAILKGEGNRGKLYRLKHCATASSRDRKHMYIIARRIHGGTNDDLEQENRQCTL